MKEGARGGTMGFPAIDLLELSANVCHKVASGLKGPEPLAAVGLFRRFLSWSPSCLKAVQVSTQASESSPEIKSRWCSSIRLCSLSQRLRGGRT